MKCTRSIVYCVHIVDYRAHMAQNTRRIKRILIFGIPWRFLESICPTRRGGDPMTARHSTGFCRSERLPFNQERDRSVLVGFDATLDNCAAVDRTHGLFDVFKDAVYADFLSGLTGPPLGDYELVAITEFISLICFAISLEPSLKNSLVCYVGVSKRGDVGPKSPSWEQSFQVLCPDSEPPSK